MDKLIGKTIIKLQHDGAVLWVMTADGVVYSHATQSGNIDFYSCFAEVNGSTRPWPQQQTKGKTMTKEAKSLESLQTFHPRPGIKVTCTPRGVVVEHSDQFEYSVSVVTTGQIVSQNGGRSTCSMVLAKGLK